jgi:putative transposase
MPNYRRIKISGTTYFFTVNLLERRTSLLTDHVDQLREAVAWVRKQHPFHIDAWVVMPGHMHAIWTLPEGDDNYALRWASIKRQFSKALPVEERRSLVRRKRGERGIWQRRFWEHVIRDDLDFQTIWISSAMSITFITIQSNTVTQNALLIGLTPHFIDMWNRGFIRLIGMLRSSMILRQVSEIGMRRNRDCALPRLFPHLTICCQQFGMHLAAFHVRPQSPEAEKFFFAVE